MAKRTYPSPAQGNEQWDAELSTWRDNLQLFPTPLHEPTGGLLTNIAPANQNDRGIAAVNDTTAGWIIVLSDGTNWVKIPKQAAAQANSVAATVGALVTDFNALLAKLRTSGALAP